VWAKVYLAHAVQCKWWAINPAHPTELSLVSRIAVTMEIEV